jgi:hypothetical protein
MRSLAVAVLVAFVASPAIAADKNEDAAKEAAVAFLKAVKARDADALMKAVSTPFAYREGEKLTVMKGEDELKKWIKERLEEVKDADKVPTDVSEMHTFANLKDKVKDEELRKTIEEVVGRDGFIAVVEADGKKIPLLVRVKDGKGKVVGPGR